MCLQKYVHLLSPRKQTFSLTVNVTVQIETGTIIVGPRQACSTLLLQRWKYIYFFIYIDLYKTILFDPFKDKYNTEKSLKVDRIAHTDHLLQPLWWKKPRLKEFQSYQQDACTDCSHRGKDTCSYVKTNPPLTETSQQEHKNCSKSAKSKLYSSNIADNNHKTWSHKKGQTETRLKRGLH